MLYILSFTFIFLAWVIIYPATDFYLRFLSPSVMRRDKSGVKQICLTFDDGPDPQYTPHLLNLLRKARIRAVFFLKGNQAEQHPDLVRQILLDGHEIGSHTYHHRHAYLIFLRYSLNTVYQGKEVLEKIMGKPIVWFRPPWGALNLFQYVAVKNSNMNVALWSANANDWKATTRPAWIICRLREKTTSGTIIVLHDAGGAPNAPLNTLQALPEFIDGIKSAGYHFVTLTEMVVRQKKNPRHSDHLTEVEKE